MLNTIYVISNMHLNYNVGIRPNGHFSLQKVLPLCEGEGMGLKMTLPFLSVGTNLLYDGLLRSQILFM